MRRTITFAVVLLALASTAQAQSRFGLELRGGAAFPTSDLDESKLNTGGGGGATFQLQVMPHLLTYAGWDWYTLRTDEAFLGGDFDVENTGYAFGLQFQHPVLQKIGYWVRGGALYKHIELEDDDGEIIEDSGHDFGWEAGGGVRVELSPRFALTPGVRYRTLSTELTIGTTTRDVDLSYIAAELGLQFNFGARGLSAIRTR